MLNFLDTDFYMFNDEFDDFLAASGDKSKLFLDFEGFIRESIGNKITHTNHVNNIGRCRCDPHVDTDDCWRREVARMRKVMLPH